MRVMVLVKATPDSEKGEINTPAELRAREKMSRFNEELQAAGIRVMAAGLKPSSAGARVSLDGEERIVTDGPFTEAKELIAGFWLWDVKDMAEAIAWAKHCPNPNPLPGPSAIEIRPLYEAADLQ
ncbi:MAG: YciI family protein [Hyphomicrobiales bacterium]|nr:MAG: YciI family protein [Hyphomicrobiales bacterium]